MADLSRLSYMLLYPVLSITKILVKNISIKTSLVKSNLRTILTIFVGNTYEKVDESASIYTIK